MMAEAVIVDFLRTPFSRSRPRQPEKDAFNKLRMDEAMARVVAELVRRNGLKAEEIGDLLVGCAMQMGENWLFGGKTVGLLAGLPAEVPSQGMDRQCISGMSALHQGAMEIMLGYSEVVLACGMEHMTHVPMDPSVNPDLLKVNPRLFQESRYDMQTSLSMGLTAEKLFGMTDLTREDLDRWSVGSHQKAAAAAQEGYFAGEILPMQVPDEEGNLQTVDRDLSVRPDTTLEALAELKPAFNPEGVITAGNSSPLNAGAAAVLLMSAEKAAAVGMKPLARVISMGWAGVDPSIMGAGPVPASRMALEKAGLKAEEIDYWEVNEAFAVVSLYLVRELGVEPERVNVKGGAIAIGHPLAASGPRITGTLARILQEKGGRYGLATMCGGGGQGGAIILEKA
jgi:acetyl-CoA C-acetyltransferase